MPNVLRETAMKLTITIDQLLLQSSNDVGTNCLGCCALGFGRIILCVLREPLLA